MMPPKLKAGDHIRVIAPAQSLLPEFTNGMVSAAEKRLQSLGLSVSYGQHIRKKNEFKSSPEEDRLLDLHEAFADPKVNAILPVAGGSTSNQLLKKLDYELISANPKIFCGMSDNTSLINAIYVKTGLITYHGPHLVYFGAERTTGYTLDYFKKCCFENKKIKLRHSPTFYNTEFDAEEFKNDNYWVINEGKAEGKIIGGNLYTFCLLQGSEFFPDLQGTILILEDNGRETTNDIQNQLQAIINQPNFDQVKGILIGRFHRGTHMTKELLAKIIKTKEELNNIPVVGNVDFGHTMPMVTFPIGGTLNISAYGEEAVLEIL